MTKTVVIVAPHFPPSNLTAGHRSRYFANHLHKFGWQVKILTVDPRFYEERLEPELEVLLPSEAEIIRTKALSTKPIRWIGDLGIRSFWWHYRALVHLVQQEKIDLLYIPIPSNYSALLGPLLYRRFKIPYAIDYIDPWVHPWPGSEKRWSKDWFAYHSGRLLEPLALRKASLITAVAPGYYAGVLERYPWIDPTICVAMPYGAEIKDFDYIDIQPRGTYLFDRHDGCTHIVYAGAMLPKAYSTLTALLQALCLLKEKRPTFAQKLKFHFVGTGSNPVDPNSFTVKPWAAKYDLLDTIIEHPARIPYLDVLAHLKNAQGVLVLGSSERHYTPSKVFQAVLSHRPVLVLLHRESTAVDILQRANAGVIVGFDEQEPAELMIEEIALAIEHLVEQPYSADQVNWSIFQAYSAETMTAQLAQAFDRVLGDCSRTVETMSQHDYQS